ncbi:MAG: hypothetical protein QOH89_2940 [Pseudonocardiales bacterium]|jgi:hypothetical protein|nr:hypothetical protein [Pseudonocardiales bacterium]MDT4940099.1 hypothetical protein [Pseudonocardiales bacterium]
MSAIAAGTGNTSVIGVIRRPRRLRIPRLRVTPAQQAAYVAPDAYIPTGTADLWRSAKPGRSR